MKHPFSFEIENIQESARAGTFHTTHGEIRTPVFAPVGTQATVKSLTPKQLKEINASLILANTYHLYLRPGHQIIAELGGLHAFMNWNGPILTDSGGFQVFSLGGLNQIDDDGVTIKSHIDGSTHRLTPEKSIEIQENLGADIIMAFDECSKPYDRNYVERAMQRTHNWAERCLKVHNRDDQALFGIVQGGIFPDLREESVKYISSLDFPGIAVGGLSVGETKNEMYTILDTVNKFLPENKPRYLMGVGTPEDLINGVLRGVDIFDCVLPTRLARHKAAFTSKGRINLSNAKYSRSPSPIEENCKCYTCQNFSRAYIRHLIVAKEMLSSTLLSIHNLHTLLKMSAEIREAIIAGTFDVYTQDFFRHRNDEDLPNHKS
jgi:queuine tRNA-ribosyltransferase